MSTFVLVNGYEHYETTDGKRTFLGPVHHAATRRVGKARAKLAAIRGKRQAEAQPEQPTQPAEVDPNATTVMFPLPRLGDAFQTATQSLRALNLPTISIGNVPQRPDGYQPKRRRPFWLFALLAWVATFWRNEVTPRLYDEEWHVMVRNCAQTVGWVGLVITAVLVFGKGLVWVVML